MATDIRIGNSRPAALLREKAPEVAWRLGEEAIALPPWHSFERSAEVCFALGIGKGLTCPPEGDQHLVFIDWEPAHLRAFLDTEEASELLAHPRAHIALLDQHRDDTFRYLQGFFSGLSAQVEIHPSYAEDPFAKNVAHRLLSDNQAAYRVVDELLHYPHIAASHILENLEALPHSSDAAHFFGKFRGVPALICGAGPSLNHILSQLQTLRNRALIFAPGSALNALSAHSIRPHFGLGMDPYHAQYERLMSGSAFEIPFFYTGRWLPEARRAFSGPLLYVSGTAHPMAKWIDKKLGIGDQEVTEGSCGVHLAAELARLMGCDPIVYVGMDLAYTEGKLYGAGVGDGRDLETRREGQHYLDGLVEVKDIHGKPVWTQWKWLEEARVLSDYARRYPEVTFLNATGGGLGLGEIPEVALSEVTLGSPSCLEERAWAAMGGLLEKRGDLKKTFWESLERCQNLLQELQGVGEGGKRALLEVELGEEIAYRTYLAWPVQAFQSRLERGRRLIEVQQERDRLLLRAVELLY